MKVFVTGASGFIGSAVVRELLAAGHQVVGLARSDSSAAALDAAGVEVLRGSLEDLDSLREGASTTEGVVHCGFIHNFSNYAASAAADRLAIEALGEALAGSGRPLVVTSSMSGNKRGQLTTEEDDIAPNASRFSEQTALPLAANGVRVSVIRLPPTVHGEEDKHGFIPTLIEIAREKGVSAYPGDGANRWPAVHHRDAARLFRLALENAPAGSRLFGVADEGVTTRAIAEAIGRHLNLPIVSVPSEKVSEHFGWLGAFFSLDVPASSALTQQRFGWQPTQPGLIEDLEQGHYFDR